MNEKDFEDRDFQLKLPEEQSKKSWQFCPRCGSSLPEVNKLRYCMACGLDIEYFKKTKSLPPTILPSFKISIKLNDDELTETKGKKLWSTPSSIGFPILSFFLIEILILVVSLIFIMPFMFSAQSPNELLDLLTSPLFVSLATISELVFFIIPIWYVGKFIQNPTFNNRIKILGIFNNEKKDYFLLKEVLIGLLFAVSAYFIVNIVSFLTDLSFGVIFGPGFLERAYGSAEETGFTAGFFVTNIFELILIIAMMILIVAPSEEIIFRGFTQKGLDRRLGQKWALISTALLFTFFHVMPLLMPAELFLVLFPPYFVISLMFGALVIWRKENLIACIIGHGVYNSILILIPFLL